MKLRTKQVQNIVTGMAMISQEVQAGKLKLDVGTSFAIAIAKKQLAPVYEAFTETRDALLNEFTVKDEKGEKVKIPAVLNAQGQTIVQEQWDLGGRGAEWTGEVKKLLLEEHEIDRLNPLPMENFKLKKVNGEDGDIDPDILFLLSPWLVME